MRQKIIAVAVGLGLAGIAAIGAYASQDSVNTQADTPTVTVTATDTAGPGVDTPTATDTAGPTETDTPTPESTATEAPTDTATPEVTQTPGIGRCDDDEHDGDHNDGDHEGDDDDEGSATATATATPSLDNQAAPPTGSDCKDDEDHGGRDVKGIPSDNPNHHPDDGDGLCEKGETAIKTTPGGTQVNVPCQAADHGDNEHETEGGGDN